MPRLDIACAVAIIRSNAPASRCRGVMSSSVILKASPVAATWKSATRSAVSWPPTTAERASWATVTIELSGCHGSSAPSSSSNSASRRCAGSSRSGSRCRVEGRLVRNPPMISSAAGRTTSAKLPAIVRKFSRKCGPCRQCLV